MIGAISDALISRASARISETAPGRTPIAAARPPLVLPGFASPRSIILTSSMASSFPNFRNDSNSDYPKSSLTLISEYQKLNASFRGARQRRSGIRDDHARGDSGFASSTRPGMTRTHAPAMQESEKHRMQSTSWTPEHSSALQEYLAKGMSYSEIAEAINAKFNTAYTRHAAIGRARRLGLLGAARPGDSSRLAPEAR